MERDVIRTIRDNRRYIGPTMIPALRSLKLSGFAVCET
jgi:hypothetical protein